MRCHDIQNAPDEWGANRLTKLQTFFTFFKSNFASTWKNSPET